MASAQPSCKQSGGIPQSRWLTNLKQLGKSVSKQSILPRGPTMEAHSVLDQLPRALTSGHQSLPDASGSDQSQMETSDSRIARGNSATNSSESRQRMESSSLTSEPFSVLPKPPFRALTMLTNGSTEWPDAAILRSSCGNDMSTTSTRPQLSITVIRTTGQISSPEVTHPGSTQR